MQSLSTLEEEIAVGEGEGDGRRRVKAALKSWVGSLDCLQDNARLMNGE